MENRPIGFSLWELFSDQTGDRARADTHTHTYGAGTYHVDKVEMEHLNIDDAYIHNHVGTTYNSQSSQSVSQFSSVQSAQQTKSLFKTKYISLRPSDRATYKCRCFGKCFNESHSRKEMACRVVRGANRHTSFRLKLFIHPPHKPYQAAHPPFFVWAIILYIADALKRLDRLQHHSFFSLLLFVFFCF